MVWKGDDIYVTQSVLLEMCQITYIVEAGWLPDENNAKNEEIITFNKRSNHLSLSPE